MKKIHLIFGNDYFLRDEKINEIIKKNNFDVTNLKRKKYHFETQKNYLELFFDLRTKDLWKKKIIIINFEKFPLKDKKFQKILFENLEKSPHLIFLNINQEKTKKNLLLPSFFEVHKLKKITKATIKKWILYLFKKHHLVYDEKIIPFLINVFPKNIAIINLEIEKIILFQKKTQKIINYENLQKIINCKEEENIFTLIEAILTQNESEIKNYIKKFTKEMFNPSLIFQTITTYLLLIKKIMYYQKNNLTFQEIITKTKKNYFFIISLTRIINKTNIKKINILIEKVYNFERDIKRINLDEKTILISFLLNIF